MHIELLKHPIAAAEPRAHLTLSHHQTMSDGTILIGPELRSVGELESILKLLRADLDRIEAEARRFLK